MCGLFGRNATGRSTKQLSVILVRSTVYPLVVGMVWSCVQERDTTLQRLKFDQEFVSFAPYMVLILKSGVGLSIVSKDNRINLAELRQWKRIVDLRFFRVTHRFSFWREQFTVLALWFVYSRTGDFRKDVVYWLMKRCRMNSYSSYSGRSSWRSIARVVSFGLWRNFRLVRWAPIFEPNLMYWCERPAKTSGAMYSNNCKELWKYSSKPRTT